MPGIMYDILDYFDLGILPEEVEFGKPKEDEERKAKERARQRLWLTLVMYVGVFLGVLGENVVSLFNAGKSIDWDTFGVGRLLVALVITTVIFPQVFPRIFDEKARKREKVPAGERLLQFCVAFQNGFFWPPFIKAIGQTIQIVT